MDAPVPDRETLDKQAARQLGLFTRAQALECGFSTGQVVRRLQEGDWVELRRGVLAERGLRVNVKIRDMAVLLTVPGAVLTGPSALRWHGVNLPDTGTCIALGLTSQARPRGVAIFREDVPDEDVVLFGDACVAEFERAIFDSARILPDLAAHALLVQAVERGWTTLARLADRVSAFTNRRGAPRLVRLLQQAAKGNRDSSTRLAKRLLERAGLWGWTANAPISDRWGLICVGDLAFQQRRVLIQLDGTSEEFSGEREFRLSRRHDRLKLAGWTVLTFGWHELGARPEEVVQKVRFALDQNKG
jgi:Transcriptional regulator, AbiEi antitoxin